MLATLFRSKRDRDPQWRRGGFFSSPFSDRDSRRSARGTYDDQQRRLLADYEDDDEGRGVRSEQEEEVEGIYDDAGDEDEADDDDHGEDEEEAPLLPIFEASHLGMGFIP